MKKIIFAIIFALTLHSNSFAQSLSETENWILSKTPSFQPLGLKYSFENGNLIGKYEMPLAAGGKKTKDIIPLKDVISISTFIGDDFISLKLKCETDCTYEELSTSDGDFISEEMQGHFLFEIYGDGKIDKALAPRLEKAFLKLIELNGGQAKIIKDEVKEPF